LEDRQCPADNPPQPLPQSTPEANRIAQAVHALNPLIQVPVGALTHLANMTDAHHLRDVIFT
jgi:hypothetical protein